MQMREIDRLTTERYGVPSLTLMENAASATVRRHYCLGGNVSEKTFWCCAGRYNGAMARRRTLLATAGAKVDVVLIGKIEATKVTRRRTSRGCNRGMMNSH